MSNETREIVIDVPASAVVLVTVCPHCGQMHAHAMAHRPQELNARMGILGVVAFPDAVSTTCTQCGRNYLVEFAKPVCRACEALNAASSRAAPDRPGYSGSRCRECGHTIQQDAVDGAGQPGMQPSAGDGAAHAE